MNVALLNKVYAMGMTYLVGAVFTGNGRGYDRDGHTSKGWGCLEMAGLYIAGEGNENIFIFSEILCRETISPQNFEMIRYI